MIPPKLVSLNDSTSFANIVEKTEKNDSTKKVSWNDSTQNDLLNDSTLERIVNHSTVESFNAKTHCGDIICIKQTYSNRSR